MTEKPTYKELEKRIQELELAESHCRHSEEQLIHFRDLMDYVISHAKSAIAVHDRDLKYIYASKRYLEEYKIEEHIIGKHHYEVFSDLPQKWRDVYQRSLAGEVLGAEEDPYYREDGSVDWTCWECRPWYESNGSIGGIIVYSEVINERKKVVESLKESEHKLTTHLQDTPIGAISWDLDFKTIEWNPAAENIFGFSKAEAMGKHVTELILPEGMKELVDGIFRDFIFEKGGTRSTNENVTKDGRPIICDWYNTTLKDFAGNIIGVASLVHDITERNQIFEALKKQKEFNEKIVQTSNAIIIGLDKNHKIKIFNKGAEKITGFKARDVLGRDWFKIFFKPDIYDEMSKVWEIAWGAAYDSYVNPILSKNGDEKTISWQTTGLYDGADETTHMLISIGEDVTEHAQDEEALQRSEALLKATQKLTKVGGWEWDVEKQTMFWTDQVYQIHDLQPRDFPPGSMKHIEQSIECYNLEDRPIVLEAFKDCVEKGQPYELEFPFRTRKGRQIWIRTIAKAIKEKGNIVKIVGNIMDITDRKQEEEILRESEERFRQIYEQQAVGVARVSLDFQIESVNKAYCSMIGYQEEELIGKYLRDITHPEILEENLRLQSDLVSGEKDHYRLEKQFIHKNGDVIHGILDANLVRNSEGKPLYVLGSVVDITERKKIEQALQESEEKYRSMMESMRDAAYICSPELCIEYMNAAMIDRVGRDATGETCHKAIYKRNEKCPWCVFDHIQKGEFFDYEVADPKDSRYYSVTNSPIFHSTGLASKLTIFHDVTEIKITEENLLQAQKMESIGTLTGGIAHDFNNLLYMIIGNTELALEDIPEWNPAYTNLEDIKTASLRAAAIVKQLLSFSRKGDQELQPIRVVAVIKDSLKFLRSTIPTTIEIQAQLPDDDRVILADSTQINQVMMNLCINASQAMEETGGTLEISAEKTICEAEDLKKFPDLAPGNYLKITVSDTGPGIRPEIVNQIFDPYYTTKEMGKGSGMGLSIVHGIVKNHGGAIFVDSSLGSGATFILLFPMVEEQPVNETETDDEYPSGTETILFVDDEQAITDMNQKVLKKLGYRVEARLNPVEALDLFQSKPGTFDLVITDMTMPQMTGVKLSNKLREIQPDIPIIICTGHSSLIDEKKAGQLGISGYIKKPASISTIAKVIRNVLDK